MMLRLLAIVLSLAASLSSGFVAKGQHQQKRLLPANILPTDKLGKEAPTTACFANRSRQLVSAKSLVEGEETTIIDPDFRVAGIFLTGGILLDFLPILKFTLGPLITLLGILFLVQTVRLKFACEPKAFALWSKAQEPGENVVVGGENRWSYDSFVNYEFFPKGWIDQPQGPLLVYFKETQTPSEKWNDSPGKFANTEEALAEGAKPGQVHFFPAVCNCQQLKAEWERRGCNKL